MKHSIKSDLRAISPLHRIAKLCAILPPFDANYNFQCHSAYWYPILMIAITSGIAAFSIYEIPIYFSTVENTVYLLALAGELLLIVATLGAIICLNLVQGKNVCKFLKAIQRVDEDLLAYKLELKDSVFPFYVEIMAFHTVFAANFAYNLYVYSSMFGLNIVNAIAVRYLMYYMVVINTLILRTYAKVIRFRFQSLNEILEQVATPKIIHGFVGVKKVMPFIADDVWQLQKLMKIFTDLSLIIRSFNDIFGSQLMAIFGWILVNVLMAIDVMLVYGNGQKLLVGVQLGPAIFFMLVIWILIPFFILFTMSAAFDGGSSEAVNTGDICYSLIHKLTLRNGNKALIAELRNFASQATTRCPQFSCGGFYILNYSNCFSLIGVLTSYLIVLIQFHTY